MGGKEGGMGRKEIEREEGTEGEKRGDIIIGDKLPQQNQKCMHNYDS